MRSSSDRIILEVRIRYEILLNDEYKEIWLQKQPDNCNQSYGNPAKSMINASTTSAAFRASHLMSIYYVDLFSETFFLLHGTLFPLNGIFFTPHWTLAIHRGIFFLFDWESFLDFNQPLELSKILVWEVSNSLLTRIIFEKWEKKLKLKLLILIPKKLIRSLKCKNVSQFTN